MLKSQKDEVLSITASGQSPSWKRTLGQCKPIDNYETLHRIGEGTGGIVHRAVESHTSKIIALKQMCYDEEDRENSIPLNVLREISIIRSIKHPNIISLLDIATSEEDSEKIYMVMEYCELDLSTLVDEYRVEFKLSQVKCLAQQLLLGLEYLQGHSIIHRDIKVENLLLTSTGVLKLADFGMAREYTQRPMTSGVVTIWYRAPELLLGTENYTPAIDMWSAGLVIAELLLHAPLLPGDTAVEMLALIIELIGNPSLDDLDKFSALECPDLSAWHEEDYLLDQPEALEPKFRQTGTPQTVSFLRGLLKWNPQARYTAAEALGHGQSRMAAEATRWWQEVPAIENQSNLLNLTDVLQSLPDFLQDDLDKKLQSGHLDEREAQEIIGGNPGSKSSDLQEATRLHRNKRQRCE